jgi:hypothetical protein
VKAVLVESNVPKVEVMRTILLIVFLFVGVTDTSSHGQSKVVSPEIAALVKQLSWNSVGGECNGVWRLFPVGNAARRLIEIGKPSTSQLVQTLNDEERGVAAHLILTTIWEGKTLSWENWIEGNEDETVYFIHVYNGLRWTDVLNFKEKSISQKVEPGDLARNSQNWKRKLARIYRGW